MGNCLGADNYGGLSQGLVPSGGMQVGGPEKPVDPDDPWKDWYYNDYDQPAMVDGRMQSGRWDMSRESFAGKLEEKQRIQQSLAQKAQLDKANAALTAQRSARAGPSTPDQARQQSRALGGGAVGGPGTPGRPSKLFSGKTHRTRPVAMFSSLVPHRVARTDSVPAPCALVQWWQVLGLGEALQVE